MKFFKVKAKRLPRYGLQDCPYSLPDLKLQCPPNHDTFIQVDFELHGDVLGFFFRRYAKDTATAYRVAGWMKVSKRGTLHGQLQGEKGCVEDMIQWLTTQGAPGSVVKKCELRHWQIIDSCNMHDFNIRF